jgi:hypothetical protein
MLLVKRRLRGGGLQLMRRVICRRLSHESKLFETRIHLIHFGKEEEEEEEEKKGREEAEEKGKRSRA